MLVLSELIIIELSSEHWISKMEGLPPEAWTVILSTVGAALLAVAIKLLRKYSPGTKTKIDDYILILLEAIAPKIAAKKKEKNEPPPE